MFVLFLNTIFTFILNIEQYNILQSENQYEFLTKIKQDINTTENNNNIINTIYSIVEIEKYNKNKPFHIKENIILVEKYLDILIENNSELKKLLFKLLKNNKKEKYYKRINDVINNINRLNKKYPKVFDYFTNLYEENKNLL